MKRAVKSGLERIPFFNHPLVDRLIPDKFRDSSDFDEVRARVLIVSVLAIWGWGPVFAIFHAVEGRLEMAGASLLAALMITPIPFILRWTGSFAAAANLISLTVWLVLAYLMPYSGGLTSPLMLWLILVPLVPYIFDLKKSFWFWMALSLLTPVGLYVAESSGYAFATSLSEESLRLWWLGSIVAGIIVIVQLFALNNVLLGWLNERMQVREDEKRRAERKLQTTRERAIERVRRCMRTLIRRMPDGVLIFRDGRVVHSNAAFRRMLGRGESDRGEPFEGEPIAELVDSQQREQWLEVIDKVESGEELPYTEFDLRGAGGEVVSVEATGFRGMYGGDPVGFLLLRDLTERRELQSKMMQMDRMIAVGTLAAGVAHEINNPLSYIHGNIEYLVAHMHETENTPVEALSRDEITDVLEDVYEGSERIRKIVSDLSTFSRSTQDRPTPVDVHEVLDSCIKMAENEIRHRARLTREYGAKRAVKGLESNLAQVFLNLLINAAQAIPEGEAEANQIVVRTSDVDGGRRVRIEVEDTGTGIPREIRPRIFDPFFSTKDDQSGMGLGLSICRNLVAEHDGELAFETSEGEGTTFWVELPATDEVADTEAGPALVGTREPPPTKARVLLVDDDDGIIRALSRSLGDLYQTTAVRSGREALQVLEEDRDFAAIICDLLMPDVSGVEVYRQVSERFPELVERMIFLTGGSFTPAARKFVETCDRPLLLKPFDVHHLRREVERVVKAGDAPQGSSAHGGESERVERAHDSNAEG